MRRHSRKGSFGVAALMTLLGLSALITLMGMALAALAFFEGTIGLTEAKSQEAALIARSGSQDALLRIARDKSFTSAGYTLTFTGGTATISVTDLIGQDTGKKRITSIGAVSNRQRKFEVIAAVDSTTGKVTIISEREISL